MKDQNFQNWKNLELVIQPCIYIKDHKTTQKESFNPSTIWKMLLEK